METTIGEIIIRYLEGKATTSEKQELLSWLQESKEHEQMFLVYYDAWSLPYQLTFDSKAALEKIYQPKPSHKRTILWSMSIVASVAIVVGMWIGTNNHQFDTSNIRHVAQQYSAIDTNLLDTENIHLILSDEKQIKMEGKTETTISYLDDQIEIDEDHTISRTEVAAFNQLITPYGKRGTLVLEDGTKIWLNANSRLIYPAHFAKDQREVFVDGEIYLEVTPDKKRPFIVKTNRMNVEVLGTSFVISAYKQEEKSRVILASGAVNVYSEDNKKEKHILSPNEMYELSPAGKAKVERITDITRYTSWINGIYQFERESLSSVLLVMERFYGKKIECEADAGVLTCSGKLRMNEIFVRALQGITEALPVRVENRNNTYYIMKTN